MATVRDIENIQTGKVFSCKTTSDFVLVAIRNGIYEVECGHVVPEGYDDDYMSSTYHPFKGGSPKPWIGRKIKCSDAVEAHKYYEAWKTIIINRKLPAMGKNIEAIGSVRR